MTPRRLKTAPYCDHTGRKSQEAEPVRGQRSEQLGFYSISLFPSWHRIWGGGGMGNIPITAWNTGSMGGINEPAPNPLY